MPISVNLLQTQADCDLLLTDLQGKLKTVDFTRLRLERSKETTSQRALSVDADIATQQAEVNSLTPLIAALPEGVTKKDLLSRKTRAEYRLFVLGQRKLTSGSVAVLSLEADLSELGQRLAAINDSIAQVQARKAAL